MNGMRRNIAGRTPAEIRALREQGQVGKGGVMRQGWNEDGDSFVGNIKEEEACSMQVSQCCRVAYLRSKIMVLSDIV